MTRLTGFLLMILVGLFLVWWSITALGAAASVVIAVGELWKSAVLAWTGLYGWKKVYALGGAATVVVLTALYGPAVLREFVWLCVHSPVEALIAVIGVGSSLLLIVPLVFAGWPFIVWLAWTDKVDKSKRTRERCSQAPEAQVVNEPE
jgi:hypothetical protein